MPFRFLALPPELRRKVYHYCFKEDQQLAPLTVPFPKEQRQYRERTWYADMSDTLPFLQTCRQIHLEASEILYGKNSFVFEDFGILCDYDCRAYHDLKCDCLELSDLTLAYTWLHAIGERHRRLIREITFIISEPWNCRYPNEKLPAPFEVNENFYRHFRYGGRYLGDAFVLLSKNHQLDHINFVLDEYWREWHNSNLPNEDDVFIKSDENHLSDDEEPLYDREVLDTPRDRLFMSKHFFGNGPDSELLKRLSLIVGIKKLNVYPRLMSREDRAVLKELRARMQRKTSVSRAEDARPIAQQIAELEEERKHIREQVQKVQAEVELKQSQGRRLQERLDEIDSIFKSLQVNGNTELTSSVS